MKKPLFVIFGLVIVAASLPVVLFASNAGFVLAAISPDKQKISCIRSHEPDVLAALKNNNFSPKQDETGFIYSLIDYDGPISSDPTSQQNFWSFWSASSTTSQLEFSHLGPAAITPQDGRIYVFSFGNGLAPVPPVQLQTICNNNPPVNQQPPTLNQPAITPTQASSVQYLLNNYSSMSKAEQDWAAMAVGSNELNVSVSDTSGAAVTSLARVALAKTAQGISATDEIAKITASFDGSQIGDTSLVNDDIFAVLALAGNHRTWLDTHPQIFTFIVSTQRSDGSFGFSPSGNGDVDMTAAALWALRFSTNFPIQKQKALTYLHQAQNNNSGFGFNIGQASNIPSTAWAILGLRALGENTSAAENYLISNRQSDGSWLFAGQKSNLATSYAVLALSGKQLPIIRTKSEPPISDSPKLLPSQTEHIKSFSRSRAISDKTVSIDVQALHGCSASAAATASASNGSTSASSSATVTCW